MNNSNIIKKDVLRKVQQDTLEEIAYSMGTSFGPMGSNTQWCQDAAMNNANADPFAVNIYTKDGHTILQSLKFDDIIADSVKSNLCAITTNVVKKIGDGTTSAALMAYYVFTELAKIETEAKIPPRVLINRFEKAVNLVQAEIRKRKQVFDKDAAYKIAFVASNGNEDVATRIMEIYEELGNDVYIEVTPSVNNTTFIKKFNGLALDTGYDSPTYINNYKEKNCTIENPSIYYFQDPVDTSEQLSFLISIIEHNIVKPYEARKFEEAIPTVILTKFISRDVTTQLNKILTFMNQFSNEATVGFKPKLLLVNNIHQEEVLDDLAMMCGCPPILKFNDIKEQNKLQKQGKAPTIKTIHEFCGHAKTVRSDTASTVVIEPQHMYDENGELSVQYTAMINDLNAQLQNEIENGADLSVQGKLRKRINSFSSKSVEYFVGGVTPADRDALKYLVDDAVLNCRSAALEGVGYAANAEGYIAVSKLLEASRLGTEYDEGVEELLGVIKLAYLDVIGKLYDNVLLPEPLENILPRVEAQGPLNVVTLQHDKNIISSIETDPAILECISRVVTLMITCAQCIVPNSQYNKYSSIVIE